MAHLDFPARWQQLEVHKDLSNALIRDLLAHYTEREAVLVNENALLRAELKNVQLDLDDSMKSRRECAYSESKFLYHEHLFTDHVLLERKCLLTLCSSTVQKELSLANQTIDRYDINYDLFINRNPYVIVLIDGDGMLFHENLIHKGIEGGKEAANALRDIILEQCHELANEMEVVAKVCANVTGLSKAMRHDGSLQNIDDLRDFTLGFTQGRASFDFVDVGHGKERADSKIKECMRWHLRNHNCKQILLGISHDAGYAPFLEEVVNTGEDRNRVTIIEGPPIVRELSAINLQILPLKTIFRDEKLVDRSEPERFSSPVLTNGATTWAKLTSIPSVPNPSTVLLKKCTNGTNGPKTTSFTKVSKAAKPASPAWIPEPRGLDPKLDVNQAVLDRVKRRTGADKLCNNHYLRGPCAKGDECCFEHDHKCTKDELVAISFLARLNPCVAGQDCDTENCIYGHHCPSVVNAVGKDPVCTQFSCKFGEEDHPFDTVIKHPKKWDERKEDRSLY
ncbi:hypothetical protein D0Z07_4766 [Hyphodiscus hymeniophilus]|uniref:C3H1-type domain-containing protein n=1 Tax=Hyphodiscus hymeniophilus TaxID=353542 RepID=A0A9P6VJC9_9HELO|nr:hypothetical protein D0Z07_4766 [Hyphodiscus hymeniophilus]